MTSNSLTMSEKTNRYINPLTDFGFKHFFASELNKVILLKFLNAVFDEKKQIADVVFLPVEKDNKGDKGLQSELLCKDKEEKQFKVTIRRIDEELFRSSSGKLRDSLHQEMESGTEAPAAAVKEQYMICLADFSSGDAEDLYYREITMTKVVDMKKSPAARMGFIFLEIPEFHKPSKDLSSALDKWFYLLKHLRYLDEAPQHFQDENFAQVFQAAEVSALTPEQREAYDAELKKRKSIFKVYNPDEAAEEAMDEEMEDGNLDKDLKDTFLKFFKKGYKAGFKEGMLEIANELGKMRQ